jgi:hypothetical protein
MLRTMHAHRGLILALAVAAALTLLLLGVFHGSPAAATTKTGHDFTYYNNANHTTVVGYRYYCIGYSGGWGQITGYYVMNTYPCN